MRIKFKIFLLFVLLSLLISILLGANANTNTREYYQQLIDSSKQEYFQGNYVKCIEINMQALALAEKNNWKDYQATSLNTLGGYFLLMSDYWQSLEYLLTAYKIALDIQDREIEMKILNNLGLLYYYTEKYTVSIEYMKKAYSASVNINNNLVGARIAGNIGESYVFLNNLDSAEHYIEIALEKAKNLSDKSIVYGISVQKVLHLSLLGKEEEAIGLSLQLLETINNTGNSKAEFTEVMTEVLFNLSQIYLKKGDNKEAIYYARQALESQPTLLQTIKIYELLSDLYEEENALDIANRYKDSIILMKDSLLKINMNNYSEGSRAKFELFEMEKALVENKAKQKVEYTLFIVISISVFVLLLVGFWFFRLKSIKNKQQKIYELEQEKSEKLLLEQQLKEQETLILLEKQRLNNEQNEKLILEQKYKEKETIALLEQERLNKEIEWKTNQLTARVLFQTNRSELIKELITAFSEVSSEQEIQTLNPIIQKLKGQLKDSEDDAKNFLTQLEQVNPSLISPLKEKHPDLTPDDIRFLSYIYLYSDIKKVAHLFNITLDACRKRKERIAGKLGVKTVDLYKYLLDIMRPSISEDLSAPC